MRYMKLIDKNILITGIYNEIKIWEVIQENDSFKINYLSSESMNEYVYSIEFIMNKRKILTSSSF